MGKKNVWSINIILVILILESAGLYAQVHSEDINYFQKLPVANWVDDTHYSIYKTINGKGQLFLVDAKTGKESLYVRNNNKSISLPVEINRKNDEIVFTDQGKQSSISGIHNAVFSPDSAKIAFTRNNDLYVLNVVTKKEWRVTNDGTKDIYNGWSSWVYNEEIFGRAMNYRAFWWSPDSRYIAFMRFDDSRVPVHTLFNDTGVHGNYIPLHYPNPGDANPEVKVAIADVSSQILTWADYDAKADQYFGKPIWKTDGSALWVQWMNRRQDLLKIDEVNLTSGSRKNIYTETQKTFIDLDQEDRVIFFPTHKMFLLLSDKSGWMHIYAYTMEGKLIKQLTDGNWGVDEISYADKKNGWIYFKAKKENITHNDLYKVNLDGTDFKRLTFGNFTHQVKISPRGGYFITTYSNYNTPGKMALVNNEGKIIREIADEKGKDFASFEGARDTILFVKTNDGFDLPVRIKWPQSMDSSKKYPVLVNIYGGPGRANVFDGYRGNSSLNDDYPDIIHVTMDHRGSGLFGKVGQNFLYGRLGKWEIEDYSTVMKWLIQKFSFIDSKRIGITGFSYGGYLTCMALTKGADVFTCGIAGGSVTDWRLYDTHYTERYMGLPKENPEGYKEASVMSHVKNYKGVLRLEQGTLDDNVHMQNTLQLVNALIGAGKHFELMLYPGAAHGWLLNSARFKHTKAEKDAFIKKYLLDKKAF